MVNYARRPVDDQEIIRRGLLFGLSPARALFLASCSSIRDENHAHRRPIVLIPYDPAVQLREALRLGIGLYDAAEMMKMTVDEVRAYGIPFPEKSALRKPTGRGIFSLFPWTPQGKKRNRASRAKLPPVVDVDFLLQAAAEGLSVAEASRLHGLPYHDVWNKAKKLGISLRKEHGQRHFKHPRP